MKKTVILFLLLLCKLTLQAQESERTLTVSDIQKSGCLSYARGSEAQNSNLPTIVLKKEGDILSVELQNIWNNCGTWRYDITAELLDGWKGASYSDSVTVKMVPYIPRKYDCSCPYNVSFKLQGLESNKFYLTCWWFDGLVELTEGEPLVLENVTQDVNIDGCRYELRKNFGQAMLKRGSSAWQSETRIPSEITYQEQKYTVNSIYCYAFDFQGNTNLTKLIIPSTIKDLDVPYQVNDDIAANNFFNCLALEAIEVEEGNAVAQSIGGVLFDKKKTTLWAYPAASSRKAYKVPDGVKTLALRSFWNCSNLTSIELPSGLKSIGYGAFEKCSSLKTLDIPESVTRIDTYAFNGTQLTDLYIRGVIDSAYVYKDYGAGSLFSGISPNTKIYVLPSEVERYQSIFGGTFYPLPPADQTQDIRLIEESRVAPAETFDLQGRRLNAEPKHGVYIRNGKKVVK